ncbi:MAG: ABC transporter ATP-binding protein [Deltaproteobacteria bacterium]|nr:ABC transporter ATP-binding protein [Deltaproteobacteria bacterium]NCP03749.1 ABC transporter ATP-binding protein [Deltaproteobacteria bacterium]NCP77781.1 ABC transporter ATP-binding protein [Desulfuromonadales bacterium]
MSLVLDKICKHVGNERHIDNISLQLEPGTFNVLLGRTLAGKTSLMRLMAGLDRPSSGRLLMKGKDLTGLPVRQRDVAMVYQQFINYPSMTVYKNIASPLKLAKVNKKELDRRVREVAEMLHIENLLDRLPVELSGGQQQRTAIARALVKDAELLLLDEPLVNLDYKLREELRIEMREIFKRRDAIVVYATTEPLEALTLGGNTAVMHAGQLEQFGPTVEVYQNPQSSRIAKAFSDPQINIVPARLVGGQLHIGTAASIPLAQHMHGLADGEYQVGMRANHLRLVQKSDEDLAFAAQVEIAEISGSETYIHLSNAEQSWTVQLPGIHSYPMGAAATIYINPSQLYLFTAQGQLAASTQTAARI